MDQLSAMHAFIHVVQKGSFSAVAQQTNMSQATISKRIAALEDLLGVKLLRRSSRNQSLTEAGQVYYTRARLILEDIEDAASVALCQTTAPRGLLRVTVPIDFAHAVLKPMLIDFLIEYPDITVDLVLDNKIIDLVSEGLDLAVRIGKPQNSTLIGKTLCHSQEVLVGTSKYLQNHGYPKNPQTLINHNCITYSNHWQKNIWHFTNNSTPISVPVSGSLLCDNGGMILSAALAGLGLAKLPLWLAHLHLQSKELIEVLPNFRPPATAINTLYPERKHLPLKVRVFINAVKKHIASHNAWQTK